MSKLFPRLRIRLRESVDLTSVKSWSDKTDSARKGSYSIKRKQSLSKSVGNSLNGVNSNGKNNANRLDYRKASLAMSQHLLYFFNPENNDKDEDNNDDTTTSLSDATNIWFKPLLTPLPTNINHPVRLPSSYQKYPTDGVLNDFCGSVGFFAPEVFTTTEYW